MDLHTDQGTGDQHEAGFVFCAGTDRVVRNGLGGGGLGPALCLDQ